MERVPLPIIVRDIQDGGAVFVSSVEALGYAEVLLKQGRKPTITSGITGKEFSLYDLAETAEMEITEDKCSKKPKP